MIAETGIPVAGQETIAPPRALRLLRPLQLAGPFLIALLAGAAGARWAIVPGVLRARWRVDEVVTTLMLNYVAILLTSWLVTYYFLAPDIANSMSPLIARQARLSSLLPPSQLTIAFVAALLV